MTYTLRALALGKPSHQVQHRQAQQHQSQAETGHEVVHTANPVESKRSLLCSSRPFEQGRTRLQLRNGLDLTQQHGGRRCCLRCPYQYETHLQCSRVHPLSTFAGGKWDILKGSQNGSDAFCTKVSAKHSRETPIGLVPIRATPAAPLRKHAGFVKVGLAPCTGQALPATGPQCNQSGVWARTGQEVDGAVRFSVLRMERARSLSCGTAQGASTCASQCGQLLGLPTTVASVSSCSPQSSAHSQTGWVQALSALLKSRQHDLHHAI